MARYRETILASAARTADGTGGTLDLYGLRGIDTWNRALFVLDVTAASGTSPVLDVWVQMEGPTGDFMDIARFATMIAVGRRMLAIDTPGTVVESPLTDGTIAVSSSLDVPLGAKFRAKWTIGGVTPSFTFSVTMDIHQ